ncbi:hypothetical protein TCON_0826 [Astathelohania contejeani]|uniref:Uncharacterized protein n=1 Tax=Astathelohania contejeani TaxID=164912 RepID=A0ABQ7I0M5_9MICR|nr:hypothetical protein TCON_0826 [Thelohania contejeani]
MNICKIISLGIFIATFIFFSIQFSLINNSRQLFDNDISKINITNNEIEICDYFDMNLLKNNVSHYNNDTETLCVANFAKQSGDINSKTFNWLQEVKDFSSNSKASFDGIYNIIIRSNNVLTNSLQNLIEIMNTAYILMKKSSNLTNNYQNRFSSIMKKIGEAQSKIKKIIEKFNIVILENQYDDEKWNNENAKLNDIISLKHIDENSLLFIMNIITSTYKHNEILKSYNLESYNLFKIVKENLLLEIDVFLFNNNIFDEDKKIAYLNKMKIISSEVDFQLKRLGKYKTYFRIRNPPSIFGTECIKRSKKKFNNDFFYFFTPSAYSKILYTHAKHPYTQYTKLVEFINSNDSNNVFIQFQFLQNVLVIQKIEKKSTDLDLIINKKVTEEFKIDFNEYIKQYGESFPLQFLVYYLKNNEWLTNC